MITQETQQTIDNMSHPLQISKNHLLVSIGDEDDASVNVHINGSGEKIFQALVTAYIDSPDLAAILDRVPELGKLGQGVGPLLMKLMKEHKNNKKDGK